MSSSSDQFMQVKCKFQLTSESESLDSIHVHNEKIRLCSSVDTDDNYSLIVMVSSNETSNNHIVAYYLERTYRLTHLIPHGDQQQDSKSPTKIHDSSGSHDTKGAGASPKGTDKRPKLNANSIASILLANITNQAPTVSSLDQSNNPQASPPSQQSQHQGASRNHFITKMKPRIIVKQIYYHGYNEDIVAICLDQTGDKLVLINASSTIYVIPIKSIMLNLQSKRMNSSQGKSMYFYDASMITCCSLDNPIALLYWKQDIKSINDGNESNNTKSDDANAATSSHQEANELVAADQDRAGLIVVANESSQISFIDTEKNIERHKTQIGERISRINLIRDRYSETLLITTHEFRQYRYTLALLRQSCQESDGNGPEPSGNLESRNLQQYFYTHNSVIEDDIMQPFDKRPLMIRLNGSNNLFGARSSGSSVSVIQRVISPFMYKQPQIPNAQPSQSSLRDRNLTSVFYYPKNDIVAVIDIVGTQRGNQPSVSNLHRAPTSEPRLLRFYSSRQFYYRHHKPLFVCKLTMLDADELITHLVFTDRLIAIATDRNRCFINSRNCCNYRSLQSPIEVNPIIKEVTFGNDEKIMVLQKSPISNDHDGMIDSFLLVTTKSIYSIEARQSCRNMFIKIIDSHLGIRSYRSKSNNVRSRSDSQAIRQNPNDCNIIEHRNSVPRKDSHSFLLINNFLSQRDEVYEMITYDTRAFSILFKIELNSLYEAYGDKSLIIGQFDLAHRFFQLAKFNYKRILSKYIQLGALKLTDQYEIHPKTLTKHQKETIDNMFIQFLSACLDESIEDACRLWHNYVNFYLNYVGTNKDLEDNIMSIFDSDSNDCRLVITLYIAIAKDEQSSGQVGQAPEGGSLRHMERLYRLSDMFTNEFLMKLLARTLELVPHSSDLNALSDCCWHFWQ